MYNMYRNQNYGDPYSNPYLDSYYYGHGMNYLDSFYNQYDRKEELNFNNNLRDSGPEPFVANMEEIVKNNNTFRTVIWTGKHLQVTIMNIKVGENIGLEIHPNLDQFIYIEQGQGVVKMGERKDNLDFQRNVYKGYGFTIPAGKWHDLVNVGNAQLKLFSIYAPIAHPKGTVHKTKSDVND